MQNPIKIVSDGYYACNGENAAAVNDLPKYSHSTCWQYYTSMSSYANYYHA